MIRVAIKSEDLVHLSLAAAQNKVHRLLREAGVPLSSVIELRPDHGVLSRHDDFANDEIVFEYKEVEQ